MVGVPYDIPIVGYGDHTVNYLRLFAARSTDSFDMSSAPTPVPSKLWSIRTPIRSRCC